MKRNLFFIVVLLFIGLSSCMVSYKFNGTSIDYTKIKTISVTDFPNQASLVYPSLAPNFNEKLKDEYSSKTRLKLVPRDGDLQVSGEIVNYELIQIGVNTAGTSTKTKLQITLNVRFVNKQNPSENFEQRFSSYQEFSNEQTINQVQDELNEQIIEDLVNQIFNRTVANW
ncbi:MAG: LptE family protein [Paludibacteraceae bacterium]|nr:LptE family protein [Paludibacteraceae bacterium]MBR6042849.1 LptE family protein [Paludibacteraceae bacterium]